jgi:trans-2,3-dihydro-3-hydroxyanthranilate isomerase
VAEILERLQHAQEGRRGVTEFFMQLHFVTVDVFADDQFGGNPLAVVLNAEGLTAKQMQSIAAEFNLSETTFVFPPANNKNTAKVRIFTPRAEMPFAGHPNVGTAFVLAQVGESYGKLIADDDVTFEEVAGLVRIDYLKEGRSVVGARLAAPQPLSVGETFSAEAIADCCGIAASDVVTEKHAPSLVSCGTPFVIVEVASRDALAAASPRSEAFARHLPGEKAVGIMLYVQSSANGADVQCRMFAPLFGVSEDPATGSAAVALIGLLASLDARADGTVERVFAQGFEMGRPSLLHASAEKAAGKVTATYVGGKCVPVMHGIVELN